MLIRQNWDCDCKDFDKKLAEWNNIEKDNIEKYNIEKDNMEKDTPCSGAKIDFSEIDAVIFDMDGTLVESMYYWAHLTDSWFARQGQNLPDILNNELATADLWQAAEVLAKKYAREQTTAQAVFDELQAAMDKHYAEDIDLMPHTEQLLEELMAADKPACIATMTDRPQVETMLRRHGIGRHFRFVLTTPEVGAGKTEPAIFLQAAERFDSEVERTLVVEDSRTAIKTALRAGFPVVAVKTEGYDYTDIDKLAAEISGKICYIADFSELLPIVK